MTGLELIEFIRKNELEEAEVGFGDMTHELTFGTWKPCDSDDAEDRINYSIREGSSIYGEVELFRHKGGTDPEFVSISPEEALSLRVSVK